MNTNQIKSLEPGQSIALSADCPDGQLFAERSGNGKTLTIFRQTESGFRVLSTQGF